MVDYNLSRSERIKSINYDYSNKNKIDITSCNLCGCGVFTEISKIDRYGYDAKACMCTNCSLVFLNPVMTNEEYALFYSGVYRPLVSAYHGRLIDKETIKAEQYNYASEISVLFKPKSNSNHTALLDIGGSTGVVSNYLKKKYGYIPTILDPSKEELSEAEKSGLNTIAGFIEDIEMDKKYNSILLCQTVDHLLDVKATLMKINQLLEDDGVFYCDIVDFREAYTKGGRVEEAIKIDHPYYLTWKTMLSYLNICGFEVIKKIVHKDKLHVGFLSKKSNDKTNNTFSKEYIDIFDEIRVLHHS